MSVRSYRLLGPANAVRSEIEARLKQAGHRVFLGAELEEAEPLDGVLMISEPDEAGKAFLEVNDADMSLALGHFVTLIGALQQALARLREGGSIVTIASRDYLGGWGDAHEKAFSAALIALMRCLALEGMPRHLRANVIAVDAGGAPSAVSLDRDRSVADIAIFLLGEESRLINGEVLLANGGRSLQMREARDQRNTLGHSEKRN